MAFSICKLMVSVRNLSTLSDFCHLFCQKVHAVSMATGMQMDGRSVDYLVLCPNTQDRFQRNR